jgi:hypothetical protein
MRAKRSRVVWCVSVIVEVVMRELPSGVVLFRRDPIKVEHKSKLTHQDEPVQGPAPFDRALRVASGSYLRVPRGVGGMEAETVGAYSALLDVCVEALPSGTGSGARLCLLHPNASNVSSGLLYLLPSGQLALLDAWNKPTPALETKDAANAMLISSSPCIKPRTWHRVVVSVFDEYRTVAVYVDRRLVLHSKLEAALVPTRLCRSPQLLADGNGAFLAPPKIEKEFVYKSDFDTNGLFFFLGKSLRFVLIWCWRDNSNIGPLCRYQQW